MSCRSIRPTVLRAGTAGLELDESVVQAVPPVAMSVVELLASALLAALVVVETFGKGRSLIPDARALGVAFVAIALAKRASMIVAVLEAAVVAALARALVGL